MASTTGFRALGTPIEMRDHLPLLRWMILTGVAVFGLAAAWHFGLIQLMVRSDRSYISVLILGIYALTSMHCFQQTLTISREINAAHRVRGQIGEISDGFRVVGDKVMLTDGPALVPCTLTTHIRNLITKSRLQGGRHVDQTLLLRAMADGLRGRQRLGWFVADALFKLGLLGTVVGFILMLSPISTIDTFDAGAMRDALTTMSAGMAVALFTTLAGLVGGTLLKVQYYFLDAGTGYLFSLTTELTEVYVVSTLERDADGQL